MRPEAPGHETEVGLARPGPRLRRNPTPEERAAGAECSSAIEALRAIGVLDDREHSEWSRRLLAAEAPWLDDPPPGEGPWAISIPPETPEEAAEDAAFEAAWAARPKAETTHRVVTGSPERHASAAVGSQICHRSAGSTATRRFRVVGGSAGLRTVTVRTPLVGPFFAVPDAMRRCSTRRRRGRRRRSPS
jgi:hypothetical protein